MQTTDGTILLQDGNTTTFSINNSINAESLFGTSNSATINLNPYSPPELMDTIITDDTIELVYKRELMSYFGYNRPLPEVYKDVYSRIDGSKKTIFGTYVPETKESYYFEP